MFSFYRGKTIVSFLCPRFGVVVVPSATISSAAAAEKFVKFLSGVQIEKDRVYEFVPGVRLMLYRAAEEGRNLVFVPAPKTEDDRDYVLPETVHPAFFIKKKGAPREYFLDPIRVSTETAHLVSEVEIEDPAVASFVREKMNSSPVDNAEYLLVYHNYRDLDTDKIRLKADALVLVYKGEDGITYVMVYKWRGSAMAKLALETVLEEHPKHVVASSDQVKFPPNLYSDIYQKSAREKSLSDEIKAAWPFPLPKIETYIDLREPSSTLSEKWQLYWQAVGADSIFGLAAKGSLLRSAGTGLAEGSLLYSVLGMAQDELKAAALMGFLAKASIGLWLVANTRASAEAAHIEAKERLGNVLDKQFPLWEMGSQYKTTDVLIRRYTRISLAFLTAQTLFFLLFPPIFKTATWFLSPLFIPLVFVAGYLSAEFLTVMTNAYENLNSFKIAENRLRYNQKLPEYEKKFWNINAFRDNLELALNQVSFWAGFGIFTLVSVLAPAYAPIAGIALGALSLLLACGRFLLPLFGHEEQTRLSIKSTDFLRYGRTLRISENISLRLGDNPKVEVIEQKKKQRVIVPDFDRSGVKLSIANLESVTVKRNWLSRVVPFSFAKKYHVVVKTKDRSDPAVILTFFGREPLAVEEIRQRFIEER